MLYFIIQVAQRIVVHANIGNQFAISIALNIITVELVMNTNLEVIAEVAFKVRHMDYTFVINLIN